ncbi:uncharacterized protein [Argopecten irradians]|uniref:uncharacterized protein n=1 Tax=Argopecten irradians TaxID=31199 RepID=UPI003718E567
MTEVMEDLTLKEMDPEKETLFFQFDASAVPDEMAEVMKSIKELAESMLFHWKSFPIILPPSITEVAGDSTAPTEDGEKESTHRGKINFNDLFKAPTFDELDQVAMNSAGVLKKLTDKQLEDVWNYGQFEVDSINFPGQVHKWRLSRLLQKGSLTAQDSLLNDMALVLRLLIITARNRFVSHFFSVSNSFRGLGIGFMKILDILIGVPSTTSGDLDSKIQDEHMRYLVAELDIKPHCKKEFQTFCTYVKEKCEQLQTDSSKGTPIRPPPIPYCYQTPSGLDIDLRLFNKDLINNCLPILSSILDRGSRGWHVQYRQKLIRELQGKGLTNEEVSKRVNASIMDEYLDRVFSAICSNTELENLQQGIGNLLVAQAKTVIAMKKAVNNVQVKMVKHKEKLISHLKSGYRVKSRIEPWMNEQIRAFEIEFVEQNLWSAHEEAINICEDGGLKQAVYFLKRDLNFLKQREAVLIKELGKVRHPRRKFTFATQIWLPQNYIVMKKVGNQQERIPTVVMDKESPPSRSLMLGEGDRSVSYTVEKLHHRVTSSRYPFWRWWNYLHRTWSWTWNAIFLLGVVIPWCSPISLRALFSIKPFIPDTTLNQENGKLYRSTRSITQTLCSRLSQLWINVWDSRKKFEDAPDQGFLGKSFTRHLNRFWNYVLKGACGTVILVLFFPACCVVASTASLTAAITAPLWMPAVTLLVHFSFFLIFDFDCPDESNRLFLVFEALIGRILLQGLIQPIAAGLTGGVLCPMAALGVSIFGVLRRTGRGAWDTVMYFTVVKSRGRVPSKDSFVARRIAGPGLASNYFFQIQTEQALAALDARMELDELEAWKTHVTKVIDLPKEKYRSWFRLGEHSIKDNHHYTDLGSDLALHSIKDNYHYTDLGSDLALHSIKDNHHYTDLGSDLALHSIKDNHHYTDLGSGLVNTASRTTTIIQILVQTWLYTASRTTTIIQILVQTWLYTASRTTTIIQILVQAWCTQHQEQLPLYRSWFRLGFTQHQGQPPLYRSWFRLGVHSIKDNHHYTDLGSDLVYTASGQHIQIVSLLQAQGQTIIQILVQAWLQTRTTIISACLGFTQHQGQHHLYRSWFRLGNSIKDNTSIGQPPQLHYTDLGSDLALHSIKDNTIIQILVQTCLHNTSKDNHHYTDLGSDLALHSIKDNHHYTDLSSDLVYTAPRTTTIIQILVQAWCT